MILYNITFIVEDNVHDSWFDWMKKEYIKDYLKSSCFLGARLGKIVSHIEPGSVSYSLQLFVDNELLLDEFKKLYLTDIQQKSIKKFGNAVLFFSSEMEHIGDFNL